MKFTTSILKHFSRLSFWLQVVQIVSKDCYIKSTLNYQLLKILMEMLLICKCSVILPLKQLQIISQVRISLAKVDMDLFTKVLFGNPSIVYCFMCMEILKCRVQILFDQKKREQMSIGVKSWKLERSDKLGEESVRFFFTLSEGFRCSYLINKIL